MSETYSRGDFLGLAAGAVGAARLARPLAPSFLPRPERSGLQHIVLVMMENRSFDHMLGWHPHADGKQAGLSYVDRNGHSHDTYPLAPDFQGCGHPDPDHSASGGLIEYNNGACDGFLRSGSDRFAIGYYRQRDLPFYARAALDWTVCDRYFSAAMGESYPNRVYSHAAVTDSLSSNDNTLTLPTIWDRLAARRLSGKNYIGGGEPWLKHWGSKYDHLFHTHDEFYADCKSGRLPHVSYVDPSRKGSSNGSSYDDHPWNDVRAGQAFLNRVYRAVVSSPAWRSTVLVITYDEWGGFFDHVPPPLARDVSPELRRRGFRVPCVIISPFARRRFVSHKVFDHTSVLRMIEWRWKLKPLSMRDANANNLATVLDFRRRNVHAPAYSVPQISPKPCK